MSSKRVLVFGGSGMLGRRVVAQLRAAGHVVENPKRKDCAIEADFDLEIAMSDVIHQLDLVVNCAGAIGVRPWTASGMIQSNALAPHLIAYRAQRQGIPVIHISTDCVFDGAPSYPARRYAVDDPTRAQDIYGRSKALGEVQAPHVTNVRTSFIGPEHGLWAWLAAQQGQTVEGWASAFWTGSTVDAVAAAIAQMADNPPGGTVHLATEEKISKLFVLILLKEHLGLDVTIKPVFEPRIDRALEPTILLPSLQEALLGLGVERVQS